MKTRSKIRVADPKVVEALYTFIEDQRRECASEERLPFLTEKIKAADVVDGVVSLWEEGQGVLELNPEWARQCFQELAQLLEEEMRLK